MELVYLVLVGAVVGILAGKIMKMESGLLTTIIIGVAGSFVGGWGLAQFGVGLPWGIIGEILTGVLGAVVLLYLYKLVTR